jgi:uncharacterized Zn-finger protein
MTGEHATSMTGRRAPAIIDRRIRSTPNWSKIVTEPFETITVDTDRVACDGGGGPLGHPKVYLNLGSEGRVECPYCSRIFVLRPELMQAGARRPAEQH